MCQGMITIVMCPSVSNSRIAFFLVARLELQHLAVECAIARVQRAEAEMADMRGLIAWLST